MAQPTPLALALLAIKSALLKTTDEVGWLYSGTGSIAGYPGNPQATQTITSRLHHLSAGLTTVYVFAVLEEFIDPATAMWTDFLALLIAEDREKLKAFKHVRNTIAHGFDGTRATRNAAEFDAVMARARPADRIQAIEKSDADRITLKHEAGLECIDFVSNIVTSTAYKALNP